MSKQSITILNLLVFSSLRFLAAPVMAATVDSSATPALQISNQLLLPPETPVVSATTAQMPALEVSNEIWPPHQGVTPLAQPVSETTSATPVAIDTRPGLVHTDMAHQADRLDRLELRMARVETRLNFTEEKQ